MGRSPESESWRSLAGLRLAQFALLCATAAGGLLLALPEPTGEALSVVGTPREPVLRSHPVVVLSDRLVCALESDAERAAGVAGKDTGGAVVIDGRVYFTFGDTLLEDGGMLPNLVGSSTDLDASDCVEFAPREIGGRAAPLLSTAPAGEQTVWPMGIEATAAETAHFFYASVESAGPEGWSVRGVGIGSFDAGTLTASRARDGALLWGAGLPLPTRTFADDLYVYAFLDISRAPWTTETVLARVPKRDVDDPSRYQYWDEGGPNEPGRWVTGLWDAEAGTWDEALSSLGPLWRQAGMHNGIEVAYNEFLGQWLAVYSTGFMSAIGARTAESLTGPWTGPEAVLVDCARFHEAGRGFLCYSGAQHEFFARDGGRTIYVSYSNTATYQPYLHELRLAAPVRQWTDGKGTAVYLPAREAGPPGFRPDGVVFYASDVPVPGFAAVHRWEHRTTGETAYGFAPPAARVAYRDLGAAFYVPAGEATSLATNAPYAPVYRWRLGEVERYSPLDLRDQGYARFGVAFYAACPDGDGDGLSDCEESFLGSDALNADTDGDGLGDGYELSMPGCRPLVWSGDSDGVPLGAELLAGANPCR